MTEFRDKSLEEFMQKNLEVSLLVIGDEILYGRTTDLNGAWLSKYLFKIGLSLKSMKFVRDNDEDIKLALQAAFLESDIVITSGGVGPTIDDKTKNIVANFFNKKIIENDLVAKLVDENYLRFGRTWNKNLNYYHHFPEDFIAINNPKGLAPGLGFFDQKNKKLLLCGPGVPREFQAINEQEFSVLIKQFFSDRIKENYQVHIRTHSVPEEKIFGEICPTLWEQLEQYGKVSSLPHTIGIDIVVSFTGTKDIYEQKKKEIINLINLTALKDFVWQFGNKSLPELVFEKANLEKVVFGFAESCTGGLTSSKITDLPGTSAVFYGSIICYDNSVKIDSLHVTKSTLDQFGAVSIECAKEMAKGAREKLNTDYAISITGIAGPTGGTTEKPIGTVCIGVASKNKNEAYRFQFPGDRIRLKERFSDMALLKLLELMS